MDHLIGYFTRRHLLSNVIFFGLIILSFFVWNYIGKEEMPEFESNWIRVSTSYPGAPAEDVELFVTKPIEEELKGVVGIDEVMTTSSVGASSVRIILDDNFPDKKEVLQEIKDAILRTDFPSEVREIPRIRQFKSAEKAILDIGMYLKGVEKLNNSQRKILQEYVLSFENQITALNEVSYIEKSHYRKPELQILVNPSSNNRLELSLSEILSQVRNNNIRVPIGSMKDHGESKITALNELDNVDSLANLILRGNYEGEFIRLSELATIQDSFIRSTSIFKINGQEAIFLNVRKSTSTDILTAQNKVQSFINQFIKANSDTPLGITLMDDESYAVRNRLNIVTANGIMGFILIFIVLLLFLDVKSGIWVAMGIPFSMAFTLIICHLVGYTVNNMTLAAIIIVLGIVVDDAIIIAENIARHRDSGLNLVDASIKGASEMFRPILASIVTTCVAFLPLAFYEGFFGKLVAYIPLVVILMLVGSLFESLFILPSHLSSSIALINQLPRRSLSESWFARYEGFYEVSLRKIFRFRSLIILCFVIVLAVASYLATTKLKFVMFPREESQEVFVKFKADESANRFETSKYIAPLEQYIAADSDNVVGVRTTISMSRWGGAVRENEGSMLIEVLPRDDRTVDLKDLIKNWEHRAKQYPNLKQVRFLKGRWGHGSGNSIEISVLENNDVKRKQLADNLKFEMEKLKFIKDVEIDRVLIKKEFLLQLRQDRLIRFDVSADKITTALRSFVEGSILFSINKGDEEIDVRLTVSDAMKKDLNQLKQIRVENSQGQLIKLNKLVKIKEVNRPINIRRSNFKRSIGIYANHDENMKTPLEIADILEQTVFPKLLAQSPSSVIKFEGEIEDSRKSQGEFKTSVIMVLVLIYLILVLMFNSLLKPLFILVVVPFGAAGVIFTLLAHGMSVYGFFAVIGAIGMIGVVINDSIIMIDKLDQQKLSNSRNYEQIAKIASTRLRPVFVTTLTTVVGVLPTAYGLAGYDSMLSEMMLTMGWGLAFGTLITLLLTPILYTYMPRSSKKFSS